MRDPIVRKEKIVFSLILAFTVSLFYFCSGISAGEREKIFLSDLYGSGLITLNRSLSQGNLLDYFKVREKLLSLPYEELSALKERVKEKGSLPELGSLIEALLDKVEKKEIYLLNEDIFIDNTPVLKEFPFYEGATQGHEIAALRPYAEHLYYNNLKLRYRKNSLLRETDSLWVSRYGVQKKSPASQPHARGTIGCTLFNRISGRAAVLWSSALTEDTLSDYLISSRQWVKEYEEGQLSPIVYKDTIMMRNAYGIFCTDLLSGKELWFFEYPDDPGSRFCQTFSRPHLNIHGYYLLAAQDMLFTELGEKLVALSLKDIYSPRLLWERGLGEYALCTKPVYYKDSVVVGLINARGELWVSAFGCKNGALEWSTYIGTCSFLSPPCGLSLVENERLFLGTNHGILACLRLSDGAPLWLLKYKPRSYSLFDYWQAHFSEKNIIKYDTQLLLLEEGTIYYKPRESQYLYILDQDRGEVKDAILIDSDNYHILGVRNGTGIFLTPGNNAEENGQLRFLELTSGKELCKEDIYGGALKGVFFQKSGEILFKVGAALHLIKVGADKIENTQFILPSAESWLLDSGERLVFTAEAGILSCFDISGDKYTSGYTDSYRKEFISGSERIIDDFKKALKLKPDSFDALALRRKLVSDISLRGAPSRLGGILPVIVDNLGRLNDPRWREFTAVLSKSYGEEVITYRDIEIKFKNFLSETGLIDFLPTAKKSFKQISAKGTAYRRKDIKVVADRIRPVHIKTVGVQGLPDFFLLLNHDQLLCVDETGMILWSRKLFYRPYPAVNRYMEYNEDKNTGRMYADDIKAYLYGDTLIINDRVNIVAVGARDGKYLWSMTNRGEAFERAREFPPQKMDTLYNKYGLDREFIKNIMFYCEFTGGSVIVVHGNKVYSINPLTGYCRYYRELDMEAAVEVEVSEERVYLVSYRLNRLEVFDPQLQLLYDVPLDFIKEKETPAELLFVGDRVLLYTGPGLYALDRENGRLKGAINLAGTGPHKVETFGDSVLVIWPFKKISSYRLQADGLKAAWEFEVASAEPDITWKYWERQTCYYFIIGRRIFFPFRREGEFFFACIDLDTGRKIWESDMQGVRGFFYNLSDAGVYKGEANFIMTTGGEEISLEEFGYYPSVNLASIFVTSKICSLDLSSGAVVRKRKFPSLCTDRWSEKSDLVETDGSFVYIIDGKSLVVEGKKP
ncbi:MAG: hypothetical protein WCL25_01685 [bacterium]